MFFLVVRIREGKKGTKAEREMRESWKQRGEKRVTEIEREEGGEKQRERETDWKKVKR